MALPVPLNTLELTSKLSSTELDCINVFLVWNIWLVKGVDVTVKTEKAHFKSKHTSQLVYLFHLTFTTGKCNKLGKGVPQGHRGACSRV